MHTYYSLRDIDSKEWWDNNQENSAPYLFTEEDDARYFATIFSNLEVVKLSVICEVI